MEMVFQWLILLSVASFFDKQTYKQTKCFLEFGKHKDQLGSSGWEGKAWAQALIVDLQERRGRVNHLGLVGVNFDSFGL